MPIRVAIIDDDQTLARNLRQELAEYPDIDTVTISTSGTEFVNKLSTDVSTHPQVVLMDISMAYATEGIQATKLLHELYPKIKVVMFTNSEDDDRIFEAFKAGAVGYLLKNEKSSFIVKTIHEVNQGGAFMSPGIALKTIRFLTNAPPKELRDISNQYQLSERELDVLRLVSKGYPYKLIADQLHVSLETIKKHMTNTFKKLQVRNKIEAINKTKELM
ncbi:MAG: response regulator transcription factor [Cyclobacteriaceae bacterium]|nr:response regulator transcription factor [Cyclobacteriaceae bacterium]